MNVNLGKQALLHAANLSLPTFQVVGVDANLGCAHCRDRVTKVISKMAGSKRFTVDICRKQVIVKGDFRLGCEEASRNDVMKTKKNQAEGSSIFCILFKFFSKPFGVFHSY